MCCCESTTSTISDNHDKKKPNRRLRGHGRGRALGGGDGQVRWWEKYHRRWSVPSPYCIKMYRPRKVGKYNRQLKGKRKSKSKNNTPRDTVRWDTVPHVNKEQYLRHYNQSRKRSTGIYPKSKSMRGRRGGIRKGRKYGKRESKGSTTEYLAPPQPKTPLIDDDDAYFYQMEWYYGDPMCYDTSDSSQEEVAMEESQVSFPNGFPCGDSPPALTLNRFPPEHQYPRFIGLGDAAGSDGLCFLGMTGDTREGAGGVATTALMDFSFNDANNNNPNRRMFSMTAGYRIYGRSPPGYGMAWLLHQDPRGTNALGPGGGELGIYDVNGRGLGIAPALVVELDTLRNDELLDDSDSSIHIMQVDDFGTLTELVEATNIPILTGLGLTTGRIWVDYCEDQILRVYVNDEGDIKPPTPQAEVPIDLDSIFSGGQDFVTGFSSSVSGSVENYHEIMSWEMSGTCA